MATKRTGRAPDAEPDEDDDTDEAAPAIRDLADVFAALPPNVIVKAYRIPDNGQKEWVWEGEPSKATEAHLARFGAGEYLLMARGKSGPGSASQIKRTYTIRIATPPPPVPETPAVAVAAPNGSILDQLTSAAFLGLLKTMQEAQAASAQQQREHSTAMALLLRQVAEPRAPDPLLMEVVKASLGNKAADPFEQAVRIAELSKARGTSSGSVVAELANALDGLDRIKERFRGEDGGEGGGGWGGFFTKIATRVLEKDAAGADDDHRSAPALTAGTGAHSEPNAGRADDNSRALAARSTPQLPPHLAPLADFLPDVVRAAQRGVAPESTADWLLANLPNEALPLAERILSSATLSDELIVGEPRLGPHKLYVETVRAAALAQLKTWAETGETPAAA